jgi:RNA polymerase-binding transcription factor
MDVKRIKQRLLEKERGLLSDIARFQSEARSAAGSEVGDPLDKATDSEGKSTSFEESSLEWQTLVQVREALERTKDGTFGKCLDCGRPIERARLEALPWTPYCHQDQDRRDKAAPAHGGVTL